MQGHLQSWWIADPETNMACSRQNILEVSSALNPTLTVAGMFVACRHLDSFVSHSCINPWFCKHTLAQQADRDMLTLCRPSRLEPAPGPTAGWLTHCIITLLLLFGDLRITYPVRCLLPFGLLSRVRVRLLSTRWREKKHTEVPKTTAKITFIFCLKSRSCFPKLPAVPFIWATGDQANYNLVCEDGLLLWDPEEAEPNMQGSRSHTWPRLM